MVDSQEKLFFAIMFSNRESYNNSIKGLIKKFGKIEKESSEYNFDKYTDYYEKEMRKGLKKKIIIFNKNINEEDLVQIKKFITKMEEKYSIKRKRKVNIDPGYVSETNVVLASFKKKDFKKDLGQGVYAHEIFKLENGEFKSFWHTFEDYKKEKTKNFFNDQLRHL